MTEALTPRLSPADVAALGPWKTGTIHFWIRTGRLPATKVGQRWLIKREDVEALLAGRL